MGRFARNKGVHKATFETIKWTRNRAAIWNRFSGGGCRYCTVRAAQQVCMLSTQMLQAAHVEVLGNQSVCGLHPSCSETRGRLHAAPSHTPAMLHPSGIQTATGLQAYHRQMAGRPPPDNQETAGSSPPDCRPTAASPPPARSHTAGTLLPYCGQIAAGQTPGSQQHATILRADSRQTLGSSRTGQQADCSQSVPVLRPDTCQSDTSTPV